MYNARQININRMWVAYIENNQNIDRIHKKYYWNMQSTIRKMTI